MRGASLHRDMPFLPHVNFLWALPNSIHQSSLLLWKKYLKSNGSENCSTDPVCVSLLERPCLPCHCFFGALFLICIGANYPS